MTPQARPQVSRPRSDEEYEYGPEYVVVSGSSYSARQHAFTKREWKQFQKQLARKRTPGFAPWKR